MNIFYELKIGFKILRCETIENRTGLKFAQKSQFLIIFVSKHTVEDGFDDHTETKFW